MPNSRASSTASDDGAPTAATSGHPGHLGFLHELEARSAADDDAIAAERQLAAQQRVTDQLVERVVPADVLAQRDDRAGGIEQTRRVQAARLLEHGLLGLQRRGQPTERRAGHPKIHGADVVLALHGDRLDRSLAADAAARRHVEIPLEALEVDRDAGRQLDAHDVDQAVGRALPARHDALHVAARADDAFGEQEPDGEILVVPRRAHRDRNGLLGAAAVAPRVTQANLERLFGRDEIGIVGEPELAAAEAPHVEAPRRLPPGLPSSMSPTTAPTLRTRLASMSRSFATPSSAMSRASSVFRIFSAWTTPASPPAPRPYRCGRPAEQARAPSASALRMCVPRRTPPSRITSSRSPAASTISFSTSNGAGEKSSCRPPWLLTMTARRADVRRALRVRAGHDALDRESGRPTP